MSKMSEETYAKIEDHLVNMVAGEAKPIDVDYAMHLIHSYTQEKCREARLDENTRYLSRYKEAKIQPYAGSMADWFSQRIAEIKAQQEEV